jgi:protein YIPF5/7
MNATVRFIRWLTNASCTKTLQVGKLHFGYILGWTVVGSILIWFVLSRIAGPEAEAEERSLDLYSCCCLLGYSMLPLVLHALLSLLLPRRSTAALVAAIVAVAWSAHTAARLFVHRCSAFKGLYWIVLYPCALMYTAFALLTLY